jgi:hypothetical protein
MLEAAPVVDDDDLRAGAAQRRAHLLKQHRFARARLAADRDIVVAGLVLERRPEEGLAAPPTNSRCGWTLPRYSPCIGAILAAVVDSTVLKRLRRSMSAAEPVGQRQRHGREQPLDLEIALVGKIPARRLVDRLDRAFVAVAAAEPANRSSGHRRPARDGGLPGARPGRAATRPPARRSAAGSARCAFPARLVVRMNLKPALAEAASWSG